MVKMIASYGERVASIRETLEYHYQNTDTEKFLADIAKVMEQLAATGPMVDYAAAWEIVYMLSKQ